MIIKFQGHYKSLKSFESEALGDFTVITGKNGSGKSQLIELIQLKISNRLTDTIKIEFVPEISNIQLEGIENRNLSILSNSHWKNRVDSYLKKFRSTGKNTKLLGELLLNNNIWPIENHIDQFIKSITTLGIEDLITSALKEYDPNWFNFSRNFDQIQERLFYIYSASDNLKSLFLLSKTVAEFQKKRLPELTDADFFNTPIPDYFLDEPRLFGSQLDFVFYNYAKRRDQNQRLFFDKSEYEDINDSISDNEFTKMFLPPWETINNILKEHNLQFRFKAIERKDFSSDAEISFPLIKVGTVDEIEFEHLSSGEKVIIGLIVKLFTSFHYNDKLEFPELIVLDEPDAHLHPEMSKLLIDVLYETFVQKLGIKVIFVTHSPSTIALCPDNSIYQLINEPITSLKKIEKDHALRLLTGFIPTLSIDYKNHKQVFVESPTDVYYYQTIYSKIDQENPSPSKLYFISNSYGKGNCDQVKRIVDEIRKSGNKTVFGVIDWDLKNTSSEFVKVHGIEQRYSIENYLFDPVYVSILFMTNDAHNINKELGLTDTINQYLIGNEPNESIQRIIDWFIGKYVAKFQTHNDIDKVEVNYLNGRKVFLPKWYLNSRGHDLEEKLKIVFPALDKYKNQGELQQELTRIIGKCFPFIPLDSKLVIDEIINQNE